MKYLISPHKKQYKANLHCHSILSDGKKTPEELKAMYRDHGYSILSITDHERPHCHSAMDEDDFLLLTGYECYIRPDPNAHYNRYAKEVHLNLFARDPQNTTMICPNKPYMKYILRDNAMDEITAWTGSDRTREFTREYINEYIQTARDAGYLVAFNHFYWSMVDENDVLGYDGLFSMEMCNYSSYVTNHLEYNGMLYDKLLTHGQRIFCHSTDDNHNVYPIDHVENDSFGAFTMILPEQFTYASVIDAMEKGEMYSSMGPLFHEVSIEDGRLHIECSPVAHAFVFTGSKKPSYFHALPGQTATSIDLAVDPEARYVRVCIEDAEGRKADTRGYFPDELV